MASTTLTDLEAGPVDARLRSLSHLSHPDSPIDSTIVVSPRIPATPVNTSATASPALVSVAISPSLSSPPANTPENRTGSGLASPRETIAWIPFHAPGFLKIHHFYSPILSPTAPPNSPEDWRIRPDKEMSVQTNSSHLLHNAVPGNQNTEEANGPKSKEELETPKTSGTPHAINDLYEVRLTPGRGYGCFAARDLKRGTRILADKPLLIVPVAEYYERDIHEPFDKLSQEEKALYWSLHSAHGQDPNNWPKHIHPLVSDRERCRIQEQHDARVGKKASLVSIFQTNCMELGKGAAIFPNAARFNHCCNPNACFTWNPRIEQETIHAMRDIEKDEEITISYCDIAHDKASRQWELKHYGFCCDCPACSGDESDAQSFAAKSASNRFRLMELGEELKDIEHTEGGVKLVERLLENIKLLKEEGDNSGRLGRLFADVALVCESRGDLRNAKALARKALKTMLEAQGHDHPDIERYSQMAQRLSKMAQEQDEQ